MRRSFKFVVFFVVTYAVFLSLAFAIVKHAVPPSVLGVPAVVYAVVALLILQRLLRRNSPIPETLASQPAAVVTELDTRRRLRIIKSAKLGIVVFIIAFLNALRYVGSAPLWMVVGAASVNLLVIIGLVVVINKQNQKAVGLARYREQESLTVAQRSRRAVRR